jgi:fatty acid CoA ligase FadD9
MADFRSLSGRGRQTVTGEDRTERLRQRMAELSRTDAQFAHASPDAGVSAAIEQPGMPLIAVVQAVMEGYAQRPALGQRATRIMTGSDGRRYAELLPVFETITYGQLWDRVTAAARAMTSDSVQPGDRVCLLGFTSVEYTILDLAVSLVGAVSVPLTHAAVNQLAPTLEETQPVMIAASIDDLDTVVELALNAHRPDLILVFDVRPEVDDHRDKVAAAKARVSSLDHPVAILTLQEVLARGQEVPIGSAPEPTGPPTMLLYTSGSTGTPKGAIYPERRILASWRPRREARDHSSGGARPAITLNFMPMSHGLGRLSVYQTLASGGIAYFVAAHDLSTFLTDLAAVRPTMLNFVPRVWELLHDEFQREVVRRLHTGEDPETVEPAVAAEQRTNLLGGRYFMAMTGSAPMAAQMKTWLEWYLDLELHEGYGSTEQGVTIFNGKVRRPPVLDYKLVDAPELGYFATDRPHPRGELFIKSSETFDGYYKRPDLTAELFDEDGFLRTGDIVAELGPDHLEYVDRRNNVLKLAQGEFVAVSRVEAALVSNALVRQIYVYGNSARSYLLAVVVPSEEGLRSGCSVADKAQFREALQHSARVAGLQSYEIPRDFVIETEPFSVANGLLTGVGKLARGTLKRRFGAQLEALYTEIALGQTRELFDLLQAQADGPVIETVSKVIHALLGTSAGEIAPQTHFTDLGGDSMSAVTFANVLNEIYGVGVTSGFIVSPATDLQEIANFIQAERESRSYRVTAAVVHGVNATVLHARDLTLDKFIDAATIAAARTLSRPDGSVDTVLLTGATGFLGRYLVLEWLERLAPTGGKLVCLVRATDDSDARRRLDNAFDSGDEALLRHYGTLSAGHLEVLAGDKGSEHLGLELQTWQRLADSVDLIVDAAAFVNHVLPYSELFVPNVAGTAELIRIALTSKLKQYSYVSTIGVATEIPLGTFDEDTDIRVMSPTRSVDDSYANGYANSKWAGEVLLAEAQEVCGLPVAVFRCGMILAEPRYAGQLNVPDMFTRLLFSIAVTGIAPESFYPLDSHGNRQRSHYDGLRVDFIAASIVALGRQSIDGRANYNVSNQHDDGVGFDTFIDWLIEGGLPIKHVAGYADWVHRFEIALRALPDKQRQASLLPLMQNYQRPMVPQRADLLPASRFCAAVRDAGVGTGEVPAISRDIVVKYIADLRRFGLL